jgi:hypothetical protein
MQKFEDAALTFVSDEAANDGWPDDEDAEQQKIFLPSAYGSEQCNHLGITSLAEKGLILRQGQANDALHQLRIDLGHRSYLYRTQVRHADHSQQRKTRVWDNVHSIDGAVKLHASIYRKCRSAMILLGARPDLLRTYQELKTEDLTSQTTLIDPSLQGQQNKSLAWFWTINVPENTETNDWMLECMFSPHLASLLTTSPKFSGFNGYVPKQ